LTAPPRGVNSLINDGQTFTLNLRFPGQYFDQETNSNYNYYRDHYFPGLGRYGQSDPIGLEGGINTYSYVRGNPLLWRDMLGLEPAAGRGFSPYYGNWCGKNWSGGCKGSIIPQSPEMPIDSVDDCCMAHDYCFAKYECSNCMSTQEMKVGKETCNQTLVSCLDKLKGMHPRDWPHPPPVRRETDAYFFSQKAKWWFRD
jgi:RHS repeat-associated protein